MSFSKILNKTENGEILTDKEINELAIKLGLKKSSFQIAWRIIVIILCLILSIYGLDKISNPVIGLLGFVFTFVIAVLLFVLKFNKKKIITYIEALKTFFLKRFKDYQGFETVYLAHDYQKNGYLQNDTCLLLTDGYEFYIFDDMLKETEFSLPRAFKCEANKHPVLKVFDQEFVKKRPVSFKLSEISFYALEKPMLELKKEKNNLGYEYKRYTYTRDKDLTNHCWLELVDHSVFRLQSEAIGILRRKVKGKEREAL